MNIHYEKYGVGPALIYLHEWSSDPTAFKKINLKAYTDTYTVYLVDLPGFGNSEIASSISFSLLYQAILQVMEDEKLDKVAMMGFCLGAVIALDFTIKHPDRISCLVLAEPLMEFPVALWFLFFPVVGESLYNFVTKNKIGFSWFSAVMVGKNKIRKNILYATLAQTKFDVSHAYLKMLFVESIRPNRYNAIKMLSHEVLILSGQKSLSLFKKSISKISKKITNLTLVSLSHGRHFLFIECPKATAEHVLAFLDKNIRNIS